MDQPPEQETPSARLGLDDPWEREKRARSWWVDAAERDARSETHDRRADDRDAEARTRDETAGRLMERAQQRTESAYQRILDVIHRLNSLDAQETSQHLHLQQAVEAIQQVIDSGVDPSVVNRLQEALSLLDVEFTDVLAASTQRARLRTDLRHAEQHLAGSTDDRAAAFADRAAAAADRAAAAGDRDNARTSRRHAAVYRAPQRPRTVDG